MFIYVYIRMSVLSIDQLFYMIIRSNHSLSKQYYRNHNGNINYYTKPKILKSYADTIADFEDLDNIIVYNIDRSPTTTKHINTLINSLKKYNASYIIVEESE